MSKKYNVVIINMSDADDEANDTFCLYLLDNTVIAAVEGEGDDSYDFMFNRFAKADGETVTTHDAMSASQAQKQFGLTTSDVAF